MTTSEIQPPAQQPVQGGYPAPAEPEQKSGAKKWASIAGTVVVVGGVAAYNFTGGFGLGNPEVGDCVKMTSETEFETVDCGAGDAEYKVVGIDEQEMTYPEFEAAPIEDICVDFATTEVALWIGDIVTEPGTIYCGAAL
ncbi:LppU/SCO3897 family protein [Blastococcus sp. PRF04-17]|uniref:LppU/SCO3897 family protein n=1 Tax=Blastococcus sp. PRF04-17 TaxID=2933797 RepID=UPI001FF26849|nr:hypothetical protein [Blastococcus sp. PRF04-17]UOY01937.1 hypothetical protein MVA48_00695 [Blastococcus sp. PRF04-17]